jgi:hypothetical protein
LEGQVRWIGILLSGLAGALAVGAGAAGSAAAEAPEYGRCVNVAVLGKVGAFKNSGCTIAATATEHKFEWEPGPGPKPKFVSHMTSEKGVLEAAGGLKITCHNAHNVGEVTGLKTAVIQFTFEACESGAIPCTTLGRARGVIVTAQLPDKLIIIKRELEATKNKIGDDIGEQNMPFEEFECTGLLLGHVRGSVIGGTPTNSMHIKETVKFTEAKGHQKPEKGEGEPKDVLEATLREQQSEFEPVGLALVEVQENEEKIEVNTVV